MCKAEKWKGGITNNLSMGKYNFYIYAIHKWGVVLRAGFSKVLSVGAIAPVNNWPEF